MNENEQPPEKARDPNRIRGLIETGRDGEQLSVEMRDTGVSIVNHSRKTTETKPIPDVIDFIIGQSQLPLAASDPTYIPETPNEALLESCIEFIACQMAESNNPGKHTGRYRLAASALREQVETLAKGKIDEVFKRL